MTRKLPAAILAAALVLLSPGLPAWEAAAQTFSVAPVHGAQAPSAVVAALPGALPLGTGNALRSLTAPLALGLTTTLSQSPVVKTAANAAPLQGTDVPAAVVKGALAAQNPFARAALTGKTESATPAAAALLADPSSVAPSAETLANASSEEASGATSAAMARLLSIPETKTQGAVADPVPVQGGWKTLAARLLPRSSNASYGESTVPAPLSTRIYDSVVRPASRMVLGSAIIAGLNAAYDWVLAGLGLSPTTTVFRILKGAVILWGVVQSLSLHELGHAWVAEREGDVTPRMAGQMSANPLTFTSPAGATMLMVSSMLGFPVGVFATNVQRDFSLTKHRGAMARLAVAGPLVNLALTVVLGGIVVAAKAFFPALVVMPWAAGFLRSLAMLSLVNLTLGVLNLIPLGPLDGQKVFRRFVPESWLKTFDKFSVVIGLGLLLLYMVYSLGSTSYTAATSQGAGTPFGNTNDPFLMSIVANGMILWALAVRPAFVSAKAAVKKFFADRRLLKAGGLPVRLSLSRLKGKSPVQASASLSVVVPWSADASLRELLQGDYALIDPAAAAALPEERRTASRLDDGSSVRIDEELAEGASAGRWLLLSREGPIERFVLLPAEALGGPAKVLEILHTQAAAAAMGGNEKGRRLLSPAETKLVVGLSKELKAPVYELDFAPTKGLPALARYAPTEQGKAFFLRLDLIEAVAKLPEAERPGVVGLLTTYLSGVRATIERGVAFEPADAELPQLRIAAAILERVEQKEAASAR
ncbi:MAG: site-2 protease family protein [Elusimicrobiota bacterium]|jgi:Zn-dependent protease